MKKYITPVIRCYFFDSDSVIRASLEETFKNQLDDVKGFEDLIFERD